MKTLGFTFLAAAWIAVLLGWRYEDELELPWLGGEALPFAYVSAPLLLGALICLYFVLNPRPPRDEDEI